MKNEFLKRSMFFLLIGSFLQSIGQNSASTFYIGLGDLGIDKANAVMALPNGGIILTGTTSKGVQAKGNASIIKLNQSGQVKWTKAYGTAADDESLNDIKMTSDKGFVAVGERYLQTPAGKKGEMGVLMKTDSLGNTSWWNEFDHNGNEAEGFSIQIASDMGFIVAGMMKDLVQSPDPFFSIKGGSKRMYVLKTDKNGISQWAGFLGGEFGSKALFVQQTRDKGYIVTGHIYASSNEDQDTKIFLLKLDLNGKQQWLKIYDNEGKGEEIGMRVFEMNDNGFIVCGSTTDAGAGQEDIFLMKTDNIGKILWSKTYGGIKSDMVKGMTVLHGGDYVISGTTNSFSTGSFEPFLMRTNDKGEVLWFKTYGNKYYKMALGLDKCNDGLLMSGFYIGNGGNVDAFCLKTDMNGLADCLNVSTIKTGSYNPVAMSYPGADWMVTASNQLVKPANQNAMGAVPPSILQQPICNTAVLAK